jgi:hypothetical protein
MRIRGVAVAGILVAGRACPFAGLAVSTRWWCRLGAVLSCLLPSMVLAEPPYRLLQLDYRYLEVDKRTRLDGAALKAMVSVADRVHVRGSLMRLEAGAVQQADADVGTHRPLTGTTHAIVELGYQWRDAGDSAHGLRLAAGVRTMTTPNMEFSAMLRHATMGGARSGAGARTSLDLGGRFALDQRFALAVGADVSDNDVLYRAGLSLSF